MLNSSELIRRFNVLVKSKPNLFKPSDFTNIPLAADKWEKETKRDPAKLEIYFKRLPSGKFEYDFVTQFYYDLIDSLS